MEENTPLTEAYIHIPSGWIASADEVRRVDEDDDYDDHDDQSVAAADDDGDALKNCDVPFQRCNIFRYVFFGESTCTCSEGVLQESKEKQNSHGYNLKKNGYDAEVDFFCTGKMEGIKEQQMVLRCISEISFRNLSVGTTPKKYFGCIMV